MSQFRQSATSFARVREDRGGEVSAVARSFANPREAWSEWRSAPVGNSWAHGHRGCDRFRSIGLSARRFCRWPVRLGSAEGWARRQGFAGAARHPSPDEARALACTGFADEQLCQLRAATPPRERRRDAAVTALIRGRSHQGGARLGRLQPPSRTYPLVGLAVDDVATAGEVARANLCLPEHGAHSQACSDA